MLADFDDYLNDIFDKAIKSATSQIKEEYFQMSECGGRRAWRERVYCYEFYHQLRKLLCIDSYFCQFALSGEVYKGEPRLPKSETRIPDFIVHVPGAAINYAVIEVKPAGVFDKGRKEVKRQIRKDLKSLQYFDTNTEFDYKRAIFLIFGKPNPNFKTVLKEELEKLSPNNIEIWHHKEMGECARCLRNGRQVRAVFV